MGKDTEYRPPERLVEAFTIFDVAKYGNGSPANLIDLRLSMVHLGFPSDISREYSVTWPNREGPIYFGFREEDEGLKELASVLPSQQAGFVWIERKLPGDTVAKVREVFVPALEKEGYSIDYIAFTFLPESRTWGVQARPDRLTVSENSMVALKRHHKNYEGVIANLEKLRL